MINTIYVQNIIFMKMLRKYYVTILLIFVVFTIFFYYMKIIIYGFELEIR